MPETNNKHPEWNMSNVPGDTKYKQALDELAMVNEQLKDLARFPEENPNPVLRVNKEGMIVYSNAACSGLDIFSCKEDQLLPEQYRSIVAEVLNTGSYQILEVPKKDRIFTLHFVPIVDRGYVNIYGSDITELVLFGKALRDNQRDLNRAQFVARTGSWRMDIRRNLLIWSDENYRIFDIPEGTPLTYETFLSFVHPDDRDYVDKKWQAALQGEEYDIEHRIIAGNEIKWVNEKAELEFDKEGMLIGGFGTAQDITEQKEMIQKLEFRNNILTQINDAVIAVNNDERVTYFNKAAELIYGISTAKAIWRKLEDIFTYRWLRPEDEQMASNSLATYGFWLGEIAHIKSNGQEIIVRVSINTLKDNTGNITGRMSVIRDITDYKHINDRIVFQAGLLNAIEDSVLATDLEARIVYWGGGAANLLHWEPKEVQGLNVIDVLFTKETRQQGEQVSELLWKGQSWEGELLVKNREGEMITLLVRTSPVINSKGDIIGVIAVGKDIAEFKKVEKMKDEFISLVSHELRTPLTVITGSLQSMLYPGLSSEDMDDLLGNAIDSSDSLANILDNMLELSRSQVNRLMLRSEQIDMDEVTQYVISKLQRHHEINQRFSVNFGEDFPPVEADRLRVERILYNLLDNASKYSPPDSKIEICGHRDGDLAITEVIDHGAGISPDKQGIIFNLFERSQEETNHIQGFGIGLVVCRRLAEAHGGWLKVDSEMGRGSTFSFALPTASVK